MDSDRTQVQILIEKIQILPPEKIAEVEAFVDFLQQRSERQRLTQTATKLSEVSFQKIWDNPDDAVYDEL
jgi:hypothetical protein